MTQGVSSPLKKLVEGRKVKRDARPEM